MRRSAWRATSPGSCCSSPAPPDCTWAMPGSPSPCWWSLARARLPSPRRSCSRVRAAPFSRTACCSLAGGRSTRSRASTDVVLDKTGTLTSGRFTVGRHPPPGWSDSAAFALARPLEQSSRHPVARAFRSDGKLAVSGAAQRAGAGRRGADRRAARAHRHRGVLPGAVRHPAGRPRAPQLRRLVRVPRRRGTAGLPRSSSRTAAPGGRSAGLAAQGRRASRCTSRAATARK